VVGDPVSNVVISGQHLGTVCPSLTVPFAYTFTNETCTDTAVSFGTLTATGPGSGTLTLTAEGYGNGFAPQTKTESQSATTSASAVLAAIQLTLAGPITISTDGLYSENAVIQLQAVRSDTGAPVAFPFPVYLAEVSAVPIYSQNGGTLPGQIEPPRGHGPFVDSERQKLQAPVSWCRHRLRWFANKPFRMCPIGGIQHSATPLDHGGRKTVMNHGRG
jgi:hypothetical protein